MAQQSDTESGGSSSPQQSSPQVRKRKRANADVEELEVDLNLPEPLSKKDARKAKKAKSDKPRKTAVTKEEASEGEDDDDITPEVKPPTSARSEYGIWIGNLLWSTTKDNLRDFLINKGGLESDAITRVHMPVPPPRGPDWRGPKPVNKGFAYIDFKDELNMNQAIALSETLLDGRKVLIKNAKSFEGRPDAKVSEKSVATEKAPSKRIFVGNLAFDTTIDDVRQHFQQAGAVEDVFLTTFEDSGKCKGYGWVRFAELEAAQSAIKGFIFKDVEDDDGDVVGADEQEQRPDGEAKANKKPKPRKWFINRLQGRQLRTEFAEDSQTRYKKRFGKSAPAEGDEGSSDKPAKKLTKDERQAQRRQRHEDARMTAPGRALANAQRASAAIVDAAGKKTTFD